jgi:hypothetical protein
MICSIVPVDRLSRACIRLELLHGSIEETDPSQCGLQPCPPRHPTPDCGITHSRCIRRRERHPRGAWPVTSSSKTSASNSRSAWCASTPGPCPTLPHRSAASSSPASAAKAEPRASTDSSSTCTLPFPAGGHGGPPFARVMDAHQLWSTAIYYEGLGSYVFERRLLVVAPSTSAARDATGLSAEVLTPTVGSVTI